MSRFVSGGTDEQPTQRDDAWLKAQQELDAAAIARQDAGKQAGGKSLYETLQANKGDSSSADELTGDVAQAAAKQEAFEESTRLTNQFRSLDEDEIEFLDSVQEGARAREAAVKKDTKEHLDEFRRQQEEAEKAAREQEGAEEPTQVGESWAAGPRKRKKGKEREGIGGLKIRRTESGEKKGEEGGKKAEEKADDKSVANTATKEETKAKPDLSTSPPPATASPALGLGLGAYSSDED